VRAKPYSLLKGSCAEARVLILNSKQNWNGILIADQKPSCRTDESEFPDGGANGAPTRAHRHSASRQSSLCTTGCDAIACARSRPGFPHFSALNFSAQGHDLSQVPSLLLSAQRLDFFDQGGVYRDFSMGYANPSAQVFGNGEITSHRGSTRLISGTRSFVEPLVTPLFSVASVKSAVHLNISAKSFRTFSAQQEK